MLQRCSSVHIICLSVKKITQERRFIVSEIRDSSGQRFGRLVVVNRAKNFICSSGREITMWHCVCDCGVEKDVASTSLVNGATTSCGCWNYEQMKNKEIKHRKHGERGTSLYERWHGIKRRCADKSNKSYGGRGIKVCKEWEESYEAFAKWAKENGYSEELTIDRIDNNGDYCPENCRWVNHSVQQNNKTNNIRITFNGETHTQTEWSKITGLNRYTIHDRLKRGWSVEKTLTTPVIKR